MQPLIVRPRLREVEANLGPPYERTSDLLIHADFPHSSTQESNVF